MDFGDAIARLVASKRILVLGSSGSGKTTFSIRLAELLHAPVIHLDACFWKPGWMSTPQPEWRATVAGLMQQESWIMDGTYESTLDLRLPAADSVILIERSRFVCLWRVLKRKLLVDDGQRPDAPPGQKLDLAFLRYVWEYSRVTDPIVHECIRKYAAGVTLIAVRDEYQVSQLLQQVQHRVSQHRPQACK